jgi:dipeptidyl aminopeptidase/acylaminoacyl peptidase
MTLVRSPLSRLPGWCAILLLMIGSSVLHASPAATGEVEDLVTRMARIGSCRSPSFSPAGDRLAVICTLSGSPQVWTVPVEGGWPTQVTAYEDPVGSVVWSPLGDWLAVSVAPGGGMNAQIVLVRPDGLQRRRITDGGRENNWLGRWSDDGGLLALSSNRADPQAMDSYLYDLQKSELRLLVKNPGVGSIEAISGDRRRFVVNRMRSRGDDDLYLYDTEDRRETLLTGHDGPGRFDNGRFSRDGSTVYLISNRDRDRTVFARLRLDSSAAVREPEVLALRDDAELHSFELTPDGGTAALLWNVAGRSELEFVELGTGRTTPGPILAAEIATDLTFSADGRLLAMTMSGSTSPTDVWVLDRRLDRMRQVTHSPHPGVDRAALVSPQLIRFPAHDGIELSGWLYRPAGTSGPGPTVLSFHGGPEGQERPSFRGDYQALLARGITLFAPNVRGSSGFGKRFVNLDNGALRLGGIRDIRTCAEHLVASGVAAPGRIGIMGGSYGGYMVMAGLTRYPELFAAGANLFGVVNFETFFAHTEPWMAAISTKEYGDPQTELALLRELSPIHAIDKVKAPTIVLHGANDTNVPVVEAEQVVRELERRGIPVELVLFPDEGHGFRKTENRIRSTVSIVRWFDTYLKRVD